MTKTKSRYVEKMAGPERTGFQKPSTSGGLPKGLTLDEAIWWQLQRDNNPILTVQEEIDIYKYMHQNHPYSVDHALKYEGFRIVPIEVE